MISNYKKYLKKAAKKVAKESVIAIPPLVKGSSQFMKNISVNGFNGIFGDRRIKRLVKKLNKNYLELTKLSEI